MKFKWDTPTKELTELTAIIETIKMWSFFSENGNKTKEDYFCNPCYTSIVLSGCFLCEYYIKKCVWLENPDLPKKEKVCSLFNCPLKSTLFCAMGDNYSVYHKWVSSFDKQEREKYAGIILNAVKRRYKLLTGENYYEK